MTNDNSLIQEGDIALRLMRAEMPDYELMAQWLTDPRVLEFYEGRDNLFPLERIIAKYSPRALGADRVTPCFILYHAAPIGYMQFYPVTDAHKHEYGFAASDEVAGIYGIDQFIGEPDLWNRGLGTQAVSALLAYLLETVGASKVVLDPHTQNTRAIRCYEKCGFRKVKILPRHELHEGEYRDSWLMAIQRGQHDR